MQCVKFIISGKVQGVWFRASTQQQAKQLNIKGYAKNLSNGDVEVVAYGEQSALKNLEQWLWQGSDLAHVTQIEKKILEGQMFSNFDIL